MAQDKEGPGVPIVNVFWSMRSPYCYIALDRCLAMQRTYHLNLVLRPVWPLAFWNPDWFYAAQKMEYRAPYQDLDTLRSAQFHGVPFKYPDPDPILQKDGFQGKIAPLEEQTLIRQITHAAAGAAEMGKGWAYLDQVSRLIWSGSLTKGWNEGTYVRDAIQRTGIDADALLNDIEQNPEKYDDLIERNHQMHLTNSCGHYGVPTFDFQGEPFFGQDRIDQLLWRLKQYGLSERGD